MLLSVLCDQFGYCHVCIFIKEKEKEVQQPSRTVATLLMEASQERSLPDPATSPEGRVLCGDQKLRIAILGKNRQ